MTPSAADSAKAREIAVRFTVVANDAEIMLDTLIAQALADARAEEREACKQLKNAAVRHANSTREHFARDCGHTRCRSCTETQEALDAAIRSR